MIRLWKRSISMLLALVMVVGMIPTVAFAEEENLEEQVYVEEPVAEASVEEEPVEEEPVEEEPVEEEPVEEEPVEEEPVEEEPVEEEPVDEEPVEEEPVVEEPTAEEAVQQKVTIMAMAKQSIAAVAAMAVAEDVKPDGYVWLDGALAKDETKILAYVAVNGLSGLIRDALDVSDDWDVYFDFKYSLFGHTGTFTINLDAPNLEEMEKDDRIAMAWGYLGEEIKNESSLQFRLKNSNQEATGTVSFRITDCVQIDIEAEDQVIEKEEYNDADVDAAKAAYLDSVNIVYTFNNENSDVKTEKISVDFADVTVAPVTWPKDGGTNVVDPFITVSIVDSLEGKDRREDTAPLTLKDTTPVYTVKYNVNGTVVSAAEALAAGNEAPTYESITGQAVPSRQYYKFVEWSPAFQEDIAAEDANADKEIVYTALWAPVNDVNSNEIADEEDSFKIIFQDETVIDGKVFEDITLTAGAGQKTPVPVKGTDYPATYTDAYGTEWKFVKWVDADGKVPSGTVQATADNSAKIYTAVWTADLRVTFFLPNGGEKVHIIEADDTVAQEHIVHDYQVTNDIWYYATADRQFTDAEGNVVDEANKVAYDFRTKVNKDLYLLSEWLPDHNENGIPDGTAADPFHQYVWHGVDNSVVKIVKDAVANDKFYSKTDLTCDDYKPAGWYFNGWEQIAIEDPQCEDYTVGDITYTYEETCHKYIHVPAELVVDVNGNTVDDTLETIKIFADGNGTVTAEATNLVALDDGVSYVYDSRPGYDFCRYITITAVPSVTEGVSDSYVAGIYVNDNTESETFSYKSDYSVAYTVQASSAVSSVKVTFADAQLSLKGEVDENGDPIYLQYIVGKTETNKEDIYNTVIADPAYNKDYVTSVKYLAREEGPKAASVESIREQIIGYKLPSIAASMVSEQQFADMKQEALKKLEDLAPGGMYTVTMDAVWLDVATVPAEIDFSKVVEDASAKVMTSVMDAILADINAAKQNIDTIMQDALNSFERSINVQGAMSGCHAFGRNTGTGTDVVEKLEIVYADSAKRLVGKDIPIVLRDGRQATKIEAGPKTIDYGESFDLLAHAKLTTEDGTAVAGLKLDGKYENLIPGTYTIHLKYDGNDQYKPTSGSYQLTVEGPVITLSVPARVKSDSAAEIKALAKPVILNEEKQVVDFDSIMGMHIIAGYDMQEAGSLNFDSDGTLTSVQGYARIHLSEKLATTLEGTEFEYQGMKISIDSLEGNHNIGKLGDLLKTVMGAEVESALSVLENLNMDQADVMLQVEITDDPYPVNSGLYYNIIMAIEDGIVSVEGESMAKGEIIFYPAVYIPNNGIELTYNGVGGHKLEIPSDAENKALTVMRGNEVLSEDEYSIYYVGVAGDGTAHIGSDTPTKDGIYFAGAVDLDTDANGIGSDCALVTIGMQQGKLDIDHLTKVTEDPSKKYSPEIKVNDGAAVTIISGTAGLKDPDADMSYGEIAEQFYGSVHMEIPDAIYGKMEAAWKKVFDRAMPVEATPADILKVLKEIKKTNEEVVSETFGKIQAIDSYVNQAMDFVNDGFDKLIAIVEKIPDDLTISMNDKRQSYSAAGIYAYIGIVTDPAFIPDMGAGLLVIENDAAFRLENTTVVYDGEKHTAKLINDIKSDYLSIIRQDGVYNFILEEDLEAAVANKLKEWSGKEFADGEVVHITVGDVYDTTESFSRKLTNFIIDEISKEAEALLVEKFGGRGNEAAQFALNTLEEQLVPAATDYLLGKLQDMDTLLNTQGIDMMINGKKPVNVGTYPVYAISYGVAFTEATLEITAAEIDTVELDNYEFSFDDAEKTVNVVKVTANGLVVPKEAYDVTGLWAGINANTYTVTITANGKDPNFTGTKEVSWVINPAEEIDVELDGALVYNGTEQTQTVTFGDKELVENTDYVVTGNKATNAGSYELTVTFQGNYSGSETLTWTMDKAEITSATAMSYDYDGTEKTAQIIEVKAGDLVVSANEYGVTGTLVDTDAGSYIVIVTAKNDTETFTNNFKGTVNTTWTINAKEVDPGVDASLENNTLTYNGADQTVTVIVKDGEDPLVEGTDYEVTGITGQDAGNYTVTITFKGNYNGTIELPWTIAPVEYNVVVTGEKYYGETEDPTPVITVTDAEGNVIADQAVIDALEINAVRTNTNENAGTYNYTVTTTANANYKVNVDSQNSLLTIKPAEIVVVIDDATMKATDEAPELTWKQDTSKNKGAVADDDLKVMLDVVIETNQFGQNMEGDYDIVGTAPVSSNWTVIFVNKDATKTTGTLTVTTGDYVCWNVNTDKYYSDLSDALDDVDDEFEENYVKETIQMLKDYRDNYVQVAPGTTLDLNGFTVAAAFVNSFADANIIDSSDHQGRLVSNTKYTVIDAANAMFPVYDGAAYLFADVKFNQDTTKNKTTTGLQFNFLAAPVMDVVEMLKSGAKDNKVEILVKLTWEASQGIQSQEYVYDDEVIEKVMNSNRGSQFLYGQMFYLVLEGANDFEKLQATAYIRSNTGAVDYGKTLNLT